MSLQLNKNNIILDINNNTKEYYVIYKHEGS